MGREDEIRFIAYTLWEEEGYPSGRDCDHWYRAEIIWEEKQKPRTTSKSSTKESLPASKPIVKTAAANKRKTK